MTNRNGMSNPTEQLSIMRDTMRSQSVNVGLDPTKVHKMIGFNSDIPRNHCTFV